VPPGFDAEFVFACGPHRLVELAAPRTAEPWLVSMASWLRGRGIASEGPSPRREARAIEGFPAGSMPILTVRNGQGELALVRAVGRGGPLSDAIDQVEAGDGQFNAATTAAMVAVLTTARRYLPEARRPQLRFESDRRARLAGPSAALPAAILVWSELLGLQLPDDLVATGGFDATGRFTPVDPATLPAKFEVARAWGYRRILLVDGQEVPDACRHPSRSLEVHWIPPDPLRLLAFLLPVIEGCVRGDRAATRAAILALLAVDLATDDRAGLAAIEPVVAPFLGEGTPPNLRLLAHDLLSRHLLHAGRTDESRGHHELAEGLVGRDDRPEGVLGDMFAYERFAHGQMLAIDRGEFGDDTPEARRLEAALRELETKWCTRHERLMRIFLLNTRSWRRNFAGRIARDGNRLREAWEDRVGLCEQWPDLLGGLAQELGRVDTTVGRAESELLDVAHALAVLEGSIPAGWKDLIRPFAAGSGPPPAPSRLDSFGPLTWIRRRIALGEPVASAELEALALGLGTVDDPMPFQYVRAAELAIALAPAATPWVAGLAAKIARSSLFREDRADADSILRVLSLRAHAAIRPVLGAATPAPLVPRAGTSLRALFDDLAGDPASIAVRCPY
jgi:hypothetical protein